MSDLDNLLDTTLDDLADLPTFQPFSPGAHRVTASFGTKEISGKAAVTLDFKLVETLELADPQDAMPKEGDESNTMFMLDNEYAQGNLKRLSKPFSEALQLTTIREVVEQVKEVECIIITAIRIDKKDPDKKYLDVKEIQIV